ncbi:MAG: protein kinase [Myxococcales bacterium]|nr:protein kinase [Myxococcales bacterium]
MANTYRILGRIGSGGMAEVFLGKARGAAGFERTVAIKCILPAYSENPQLCAMLIQEAKVATWLTHANVVQVFDLGEHQGRYFIVMEYVDGNDLDALQKNLSQRGERLPPALAVWIIREVLRGLEFVHGRCDDAGRPLHLVHRDISPANILVSHSAEVKLADFGIARARYLARTTQAGMVRGKLGYMSPEQAAGEDVDERSDLFSTGVVLYELLTGQALFPGSNLSEIVRRLYGPETPRPSETCPGLPPALDAVVMRALMRKPKDRFACAREFDRTLEQAAAEAGLKASRAEFADWLHQAIPPRRIQPLASEADVVLGSSTSPAAAVPTTRELATPEPQEKRRAVLPWLLLLVGFGGAVALVAFFWWWPGAGEPPVASQRQALSAPSSGREPVFADGGSADGPADAAAGTNSLDGGTEDRASEAGRAAGDRAPAAAIVRPSGTLVLNSEPWARIFVDGKDTGVTTPTISGLALPAGRHRVTLVNPALELTATFEVDILRGQVTKRFVDLAREGRQQ